MLLARPGKGRTYSKGITFDKHATPLGSGIFVNNAVYKHATPLGSAIFVNLLILNDLLIFLPPPDGFKVIDDPKGVICL